MSFYSVRRGKREMIADLPEEHVTADHIGHSTLEYTTPDGRRIIRFHHTNVVTFHPNGDITLDSGGHQSNTTKKRFNEHLPYGVGVYQQSYEWYLNTHDGSTVPFFDGITLSSDGTLSAESYAKLSTETDLTFDMLRSHLEELYGEDFQVEVYANMALDDNLTAEQLESLPPALQVALDVALEEMA